MTARPEEANGAGDAFSADWLTLREPADHAARNADVLAGLVAWLARFKRGDALCVLDMGCGTGSTFRALAPRLADARPDIRQRWVLCDADRALLEEAKERCASFCEDRAWPDAGAPGVSVTACDLSDPATIDDLCATHSVDIVTGSALIDLVSAAWIDGLVAIMAKRRLPVYFALNYTGREEWLPPHPTDPAILQAFNDDQRRDKGFGPALGGEAVPYLLAQLATQPFDATVGDSTWSVDAETALPLMRMLAEGIVDAARKTVPDDAALWLESRRNAERALIGHDDILALPREP